MCSLSQGSNKESFIRLIVNADDYGYFMSVSRGILEAIKTGAITATGIMPNRNNFDVLVEKIKAFDSIDLGIHLNLTFGQPLSKELARSFEKWGGMFPGKAKLVFGILSGRIKLDHIVQELSLQIERCLNKDLRICFLNSHEHVHMLPPIFSITLGLAKQYNIPFVRYSGAEWCGRLAGSGLLRTLVLEIFNFLNIFSKPSNSPRLIGTSASGKLNLAYLERRFASLKPGRIYELMCHPGFFDSEEIVDPRLIAYHHWEVEYEILQSPQMRDLCKNYGIRRIGFRDITS